MAGRIRDTQIAMRAHAPSWVTAHRHPFGARSLL